MAPDHMTKHKTRAGHAIRLLEGLTKKRKDRVYKAMANLRAIEEKWSCSRRAAEYIRALEKYIQFLQDTCADLGNEAVSESLQARIIDVMRRERK
jgi:hypothetical protein